MYGKREITISDTAVDTIMIDKYSINSNVFNNIIKEIDTKIKQIDENIRTDYIESLEEFNNYRTKQLINSENDMKEYCDNHLNSFKNMMINLINEEEAIHKRQRENLEYNFQKKLNKINNAVFRLEIALASLGAVSLIVLVQAIWG